MDAVLPPIILVQIVCASQLGSRCTRTMFGLGFDFYIPQFSDTFSLRDNIFLPLVLAGKKYPEMESRLRPIAEQLGITHLLNKYPYEVSGGQKQRAAVARA